MKNKLIIPTLIIIVISLLSSIVIDKNTTNNAVNNIESKESIVPWEYVKLLGKGLDVDWSKTPQGKKFYNEKTVKDFKAAGVSHVRIRISDNATEDLLLGLDKQINHCLNNNVIPIIAYQGDEFKNEPSEKNIEKIVQWWKIVAERYKDYSSLLAFDLIIEPSDSINNQPEKLNEVYDRVVTEIRKTNKTRIIIIAPRMRSDADYLKELKIPSNSNNYLIAEWHFYASGPSKTNLRKLWTTGDTNEKKLIDDKINTALKWQKETGIPTWVGAWMPSNYNDGDNYSIDEQVEFAKYIVQQLDNNKIPFAVNSDTKFYNRESNTWIDNINPVFKTIFN